MAEKVAKLGVSREKDFMYYVKDGAVWKVQRKQPGIQKGQSEKVAEGDFQMDYDFIYFVDKDGDVSRAQRAVGGQRRKVTRPEPTRAKSGTRRAATAKRPKAATKAKGAGTKKPPAKKPGKPLRGLRAKPRAKAKSR
jgi:hypothetical protein